MHDQAMITPISNSPQPQRQETPAPARQLRVWLGAFAVIWCAAAALTVITAYECSSIFHASSLHYALVLWGWWGFVACVLWKVGGRKPFLSDFSIRSILLHTGTAAVLGYAHLVTLWSLGFTGEGWSAGLPRGPPFLALWGFIG